MARLSEEILEITNPDGTVGMQNDIKGEILHEVQLGKIIVYHIRKFCPYCPNGITQPVEQVVVFKGMNNVSYNCQFCCVEYYYLQNQTYKMRPEAELKSMGFPLSTPARKPFESHYIEARECKWFENIDYDTTTFQQGIWTMATEVCAQMFHKAMSGKAPGYFVGWSLKSEEQNPITSEFQEAFMKAHQYLKESNYI